LRLPSLFLLATLLHVVQMSFYLCVGAAEMVPLVSDAVVRASSWNDALHSFIPCFPQHYALLIDSR
jgi:hypothetical protein